MAKINFYAVGHITDDLLPYPHVSGAVTNAAITAQHLGCQSHIITKCHPNHSYIKVIEETGVNVCNLPMRSNRNINKITTFKNYFDNKGFRKQFVTRVQESITYEDLKNFPKIEKNSIILVAPVINEIDVEIFKYLSIFGLLGVAAQGFFRKTLPDKAIVFTAWNKLESLMKADFCIVSDEDLGYSPHNDLNNDLILDILKFTKVLLLTRNKYGSIVYRKGKSSKIQALKLKKDELFDLTGAGDTYSGAFLTLYHRSKNLHLSASFASFIASLKIIEKEIKGVGVNTIPTIEHIKLFVSQNSRRYQDFLKSNNVINYQSIIGI